jgi:hypothetical protein
MSTSLRIDLEELIPGSLVIGDTGHGVTGAAVPAAGAHGPAFAYDSVLQQAGFAGREYRGELGELPAGLTLFAYEDTSFEARAADGTYVVPWTLLEDGVAIGSGGFTLVFGDGQSASARN